ncbi:hypothetical protein PAPHI01_2836, partial [Pancytospora philotis]
FFYSMTRLLTSLVNPAGFVLPYAFSNIIFCFMFGFLSGFKTHFANLLSPSKRKFTAAFVVSTVLTLYATIVLKRYVINMALMLIQISVFICFALTFLPGGASGLSSLLAMLFKR